MDACPFKMDKTVRGKRHVRETLDEYMATYKEQTAKIEHFDQWIEEIATQERYQEKVKRLGCFLGIKTHTALYLIVETGDFARFVKGNVYAAYLGLAPGEHSSSDDINRLGITKVRNSHLRRLLTEAAGGICKGAVGHKSKDLRARQNGKQCRGDRLCQQGKHKAAEQVLQNDKIREKTEYCSGSGCKGIGMLCVGDDDGQHWVKGGMREIHPRRLPAKGKMHRARRGP